MPILYSKWKNKVYKVETFNPLKGKWQVKWKGSRAEQYRQFTAQCALYGLPRRDNLSKYPPLQTLLAKLHKKIPSHELATLPAFKPSVQTFSSTLLTKNLSLETLRKHHSPRNVPDSPHIWFKGTRCLVGLSKAFVIKCIWLERCFKSIIQWNTHICLEIAWFSFYIAN